ncbi:hypothetical protein AB4Z48_18210 [Cupriavidus sp. 2TAF22]|uniref:hypothetical protein n=1 Tax=unclassified Cupriavidus TaxID=2640874 RepID=UPI003F8F5EC8
MSTDTDNIAYGTQAERAYLDGLAKKPEAARLLRNYIAASAKRVVWNSIDKAEVLGHAYQLLSAIEGRDRLAA